MEGWQNFFLAEAGASAALAGLIFVGVSINLTKILSLPSLPGRALEALLLLLTVLIFSSLLLMPGQTQLQIGIEILVIGIIIWSTITVYDIKIWGKTEIQYKKNYIRVMLINQVSLLPYIIAGLTVLITGFGGLYWLAAGVILSFIAAIVYAWVLLIEINR